MCLHIYVDTLLLPQYFYKDQFKWISPVFINMVVQIYIFRFYEDKISLKSLSSSEYLICCCYCFSVTNLCPTLCNPMDCSTPGSSVLHYLLDIAQIHVH